ncbi:MAG: type IV pilus twitching motility protein PilT, partial [Culicoidibacterales bacterium]
MITEILRLALQRKASDIHLSIDRPPMIRVQGELRPLDYTVMTAELTQTCAKQLIGDSQWKQFEVQQQLDFSYELAGESRFRINAYYQRGSIALAIRPIPTHVPTFDQLQLPEILRLLAHKQRGLILVTGPTGSGKSTTLAAMINEVNQTSHKHIITLEDPIEFYHEHKQSLINQREVGKD